MFGAVNADTWRWLRSFLAEEPTRTDAGTCLAKISSTHAGVYWMDIPKPQDMAETNRCSRENVAHRQRTQLLNTQILKSHNDNVIYGRGWRCSPSL
jgi:hypothetical protein